jgi:leucyl aminopeptidase (aminopeptidase T)
MNEVVKKIFTVNLGVGKDERVLVFTDTLRPGEPASREEMERRISLTGIAREVAEAGRALCRVEYAEFQSTGAHGHEPPIELWRAAFGGRAVEMLEAKGVLDALLGKTCDAKALASAERVLMDAAAAPDAVIALSNHSTSHTRFRDLLTRRCGARYASMPLFDRAMLDGAMTADWGAVASRTGRVTRMLMGADRVYLASRNGTSISFSIKGREILADTGILTERGSFGNLPAGEAYTAPVEGSAEGVLILEWAGAGRLQRPVELDVRSGRVVDASGDEGFVSRLKDLLASNPLIGNIAELGIGTNDRAKRPDNILETEKILGTVHMAIGDNSSFGGDVSVPYHQDFIFFRPTLEAVRGEEKVEIIVEGEPRF